MSMHNRAQKGCHPMEIVNPTYGFATGLCNRFQDVQETCLDLQ